ncbi:unnamed protein product [Adineta ricciae]|uniref:Uncharacterized protein n=1 Tax=Adineta ricciae TaxID=249248 RepID=A0A813WRP1_ADIRI|nr:unnamed protein product [Adineta ricciae]CAF0960051.1 unnamed protein product [Adineta ricciae]
MDSSSDSAALLKATGIIGISFVACCLLLCCTGYIIAKKKNKQNQIHRTSLHHHHHFPTPSPVFSIDVPTPDIPESSPDYHFDSPPPAYEVKQDSLPVAENDSTVRTSLDPT